MRGCQQQCREFRENSRSRLLILSLPKKMRDSAYKTRVPKGDNAARQRTQTNIPGEQLLYNVQYLAYKDETHSHMNTRTHYVPVIKKAEKRYDMKIQHNSYPNLLQQIVKPMIDFSKLYLPHGESFPIKMRFSYRTNCN